MTVIPYHSLSAEDSLGSLQSSPQGLTEAEVKARLEQFGPNELQEERRITALRIFARQFTSFLTIILIVAAAVSFALGEMLDGGAIAVIIVLNGVLGFIQEYRAEKALEALKQLAAPSARVRRDGAQRVIAASEVVPGDIVLLEAGDQAPADARLTEVVSLQADESPLTGESVPSDKFVRPLPEDTPLADRENMVYAGTTITYGRGTAVVAATGMATEFGKIAAHIQEPEDETTPLQLRLRKLGIALGALVLVVCAVLFGIQLLKGRDLLDSFFMAVALAVSAVPEGLPAVVTVALALGVRTMSTRNAIVRRLASVETLGSTTVICTDKTGTLTRDEMTVKRIFSGGRFYDVSGSGYEPSGEILLGGVPVDPAKDERLGTLLRIGALCNHASLVSEGEWSVVGDPTEGALLAVAAKGGLWQERLLEELPLVDEIPFDSTRRRMTTIHRMDGDVVAYVKGAPEAVLELSTHVLRDGGIEALHAEEKERLLETVKRMAEQGLRVLGMAYRPLTLPSDFAAEEVERDLIFVGVAGMMDPPRDEVQQAIATTRKAGIRTVMITGDHALTARAIAEQIGLLQGTGRVITGPELDGMTDEALEAEVEEIVVCARSSPEHKVRILQALKERGHVVAMTGDGVNDAPALKQADIGVSMGITGTEVTRQAADIVLADDNFATIVGAIEQGRGIYGNIRKFVRLLLSTNLDEILLIASATLMGLPLPMLAIQILWVNIISDGLPALALSFDPYEPDIMDRKPRRRGEGIFHGMLLFIVAAAVVDFLGGLILLIYWRETQFVSLARLRTIIFTSTIMFEMLFVFNARSETHSVFRSNPFKNRLLVLAVTLSLLLQIVVVYLPILQPIFGTVSLTLRDWAIVVGIAATGLLVLPEVFMQRGREAWRARAAAR